MTLDFRTRMTRLLGPGCLAGITFGNWLRLLKDNAFQVAPSCWGRFAFLSLGAPLTSLIRPLEWLMFDRRALPRTQPDPVFILGSWRSGTTYLHNLLSLDDRFGCPNLYQTMYPHTFRLSEPVIRPLLSLFTPQKRFMDNMVMGLDQPAEDEMALGIMALQSNMLGWVFPRNRRRYDRALSFADAPESDGAAWRRALLQFVAKVEQKLDRPLVLKSPNHTARIRLILDVFPGARFVHIRRNPFAVYQSMCHMASQVMPVWTLQGVDETVIPGVVLDMYAELYRAYFADIALIPPGRLYDVAYEDLASRPVAALQDVYRVLELPDFERVRPKLEEYAASQGGYRTNKHPQLAEDVRQRIVERWRPAFDAWGYSQDPAH